MLGALLATAAIVMVLALSACGGGGTTPAQTYTLAASVSGNGSVSDETGQIACIASGAKCSATYDAGASVTLTATPSQHDAFVGWDGDCRDAGAAPTATVRMNANHSCSAQFVPASYTLTVSVTGNGSVSDEANPDRIASCAATGGMCSGSYANNTSVTLTATADSGYTFGGWGGDCTPVTSSSRPQATVTMSASRSCSASFTASPSPVFTIAIMPDTQTEMQAAKLTNGVPTGAHNVNDDRFIKRAQWLVANKDAFNLRYVLHGGDVVNWGERDEWQYQVASDGMKVLEEAKIPYVLSQGNHDTRAVGGGNGGSAFDPSTVKQDVRQSPLFNKYFSGRFGEPAGSYEAYCAVGDIDPINPACNISNGYTVFDAGGLKWLVLSLEIWARTDAVAWAQGVVAGHPNHNVIVVTHSYLTGSDGSISGNGGYGANPSSYVRDNLIVKYPNVRFVFSGHEGTAASYQYAGNSAVAYLQNFDGSTNPVRILRVDTNNDTATSSIYAPQLGKYWDGVSFASTTPVEEVKTGMGYIR